ncbi:MAG: TIR domain-containing protein [Gammaproteobacteria bacterium]
MRAIFISYRRDDAEGQAGRLFDDLTQHFGDDAVFMDVAAIEPGRDFRRAIDEQVASCGVLLTIIGKSWLTANDESGARRLDDPMDFVRLETASALKRDIPVVPVLVHGARMPRADELPEDLKALAFRNGVELTHARWDSDVQVLVKALQPHVQAKQEPTGPGPPSAPSEPGPTRTGSSRMISAVLIGVLALAFGGLAIFLSPGKNENPSSAGNTTSVAQQPVKVEGTEKAEWLTSAQYQQAFDKQVQEGFYPNKVEGRCESASEQFHVEWKGFPLGAAFISHHAVTKEFYESKNQEYVSNGFSLEALNKFKDCSGKDRYQATWFKRE